MANPPFKISDWWGAKLEGDPRWRYGTLPTADASFVWVQKPKRKEPDRVFMEPCHSASLMIRRSLREQLQ
jgi:type I restriction-modification system DNA methylase subunit